MVHSSFVRFHWQREEKTRCWVVPPTAAVTCGQKAQPVLVLGPRPGPPPWLTCDCPRGPISGVCSQLKCQTSHLRGSEESSAHSPHPRILWIFFSSLILHLHLIHMWEMLITDIVSDAVIITGSITFWGICAVVVLKDNTVLIEKDGFLYLQREAGGCF